MFKFLDYYIYKSKWIAGYVYSIFKIYGKTIVKICLGKYKKINASRYIAPTVLQLPITYKCNCDCVMCNMRSFQGTKGFTSEELESILSDKLFQKISSVGINGGEPFLLAELSDYIKVLTGKLIELKDIYIISNGYFGKNMEEQLEKIKDICDEKSVRLHVSISVDGIGKTHDLIRGVNGMFTKTALTCEMLKRRSDLYDSFNLICTITRQNVMNLPEIEAWVNNNGYNISYNVATIHKRLANEKKYKDFSLFFDKKSLQMAKEFFYTKFLETKSEAYYALYYYLENKRRISKCDYQNRGVTLTPDGKIAYCATYSKALGSTFVDKAQEIYKRELSYRKELCDAKCKDCSHYSSQLTLEGKKYYMREIIKKMDSPFWN